MHKFYLATMLLLMVIQIIGISSKGFSLDEDQLINPKVIDAALQQGDIEYIDRLVTKLEESWGTIDSRFYFHNMGLVCWSLVEHVRQEPELYPELICYASLLLIKADMEDNLSIRTPMCYRYEEIISALLIFLHDDKEIMGDNSWTLYRSQVMRLAAIFLKSVRENYDPDFTPLEATLRARAVKGVPFSFQPPESVKDPEVRARYEAAIEENSRRLRINQYQRALSEMIDRRIPRIEEEIIYAYSIKTDFHEFNEYLILAGTEPEHRTRLLERLSEETGIPIPVGLILPGNHKEAEAEVSNEEAP